MNLKNIFFLFVALLSVSVYAAPPTVDFNFSPLIPTTLQTILFNPDITTSSDLHQLLWQFDTDGNVNYTSFSTYVLDDNFSNGDINAPVNWHGEGWTETGGLLTSPNGTDDLVWAQLNQSFDVNLTWDWNTSTTGAANAAGYGCFARNNNSFGAGGYSVWSRVGETIRFGTGCNAQSVLIDSGVTTVSGTTYSIRVFRQMDGNWSFYVNGTYRGSAVNTSSMDMNYVLFSTGGVTSTFTIGDLNVLKSNSVDEDRNESHIFVLPGNKTVCLTAQNNDGNSTTCKTVSVLNFNENPVISRFDYNVLTGLNVNDQNAHFILDCDSNATSANYSIILNGTEIYDFNSNLDINYLAFTAANGQNTATFTCTTGSLSALETISFEVYNVTFYLVDEETGLQLTNFAPFTDLTGTDYNTGTVYDFKGASDSNVQLSSDGDTTFRLDINYTNGVSIYKEYTMSVLVPDASPRLCVADLDNSGFAEQIFTSSQQDGFVVRHKINKCYAIAAYTTYSYLTGLENRTFTIDEPYVLYFFDGNVKTVLAELDGAIALTHSLLTLRLNQTQFDLSITGDTLAVSPLIQDDANNYDVNKMQVFYRSFDGENVSLTLKIYSDNTLLWTYTETQSPNLVLVTFDFNAFNLTDANVLKVVAEKTVIVDNEPVVERLTHYFSISGIDYGGIFNPAIAVIFAVIVVIFGLTITSAKFAFGWWGILIVLLGLAIIGLGPMVWWAKFMSAILLIILAYVMMVYKNETSRVIS